MFDSDEKALEEKSSFAWIAGAKERKKRESLKRSLLELYEKLFVSIKEQHTEALL